MITSSRSHSHVSKGNPCEDIKMSFRCSIIHQLLLKFTQIMDCLWTTLSLVDLNVLVLLSTIKRRLLLSTAKHNIHWFIIWVFLFPQMIWIIFVFLLRIHYIAPKWSTFQSVEKCWCHFCLGFYKLHRCSSCLTTFLVWNQIADFKDYVWSSIIF